MDKWWVPGLQIGYEHSFVHQVADFLQSLETGKPAGPTFRDALALKRSGETWGVVLPQNFGRFQNP